MPYEIEYQDALRCVITTYSGTVTDDEIIQSSLDKASQVEKIKTCRFAIMDMSRVEKFNITSVGLRENASLSRKLLKQSDNAVVALVLPTEIEYGMGRVWQAYADDDGSKSRIFKIRSEADDWIKAELDRTP